MAEHDSVPVESEGEDADAILPSVAEMFPLPNLPAPSDTESLELVVLREEFPPGDWGSFADDVGTAMTYDLRRRWLRTRRSRDPREDELAARTLGLNLKFVGFMEFLLSALIAICNIAPNTLKWVLKRSRSKSSWYRYIWMAAFIAASLLCWFVLPIPFSAISIGFFAIVALTLFSTHWLPKVDWWEVKVAAWIAAIEEKQKRVEFVHRKTTDKIEDILERTDDHLENKDPLVFEQTAMDDIDDVRRHLAKLEADYSENIRGRLYLVRGKRIMKRYVRERAHALWEWEKRRTMVDENARDHRWSVTTMATTIGGFFTLLKIVAVVVSLLMVPIIFSVISNSGKSSSAGDTTVVEGGEVDAAAGEDSSDGGQSETADPWVIVKSLGLIAVLLTVLKIMFGWMINFVTRILMRQLQFKKVKKKVDEDSLDVECQWQWIQLLLLDLKEQCLHQIALVLDGVGLTKAELALLKNLREHHREILERLKLQHKRKTGKEWLEPKSGVGSAGAVFDSGAPEDAVTEVTDTLFDSLLEGF